MKIKVHFVSGKCEVFANCSKDVINGINEWFSKNVSSSVIGAGKDKIHINIRNVTHIEMIED
jgi:hypothetical protein